MEDRDTGRKEICLVRTTLPVLCLDNALKIGCWVIGRVHILINSYGVGNDINQQYSTYNIVRFV